MNSSLINKKYSVMEQSILHKQLQCITMEPRKEEFYPVSQSIMQDPMNGVYISRRPLDHNTLDAKAVLNYSIQTGEEFSLEFMRDRVNLKKPVLNHAGSESGSKISMLSIGEKVPAEFNRQGTSVHGDRSNYGSIRPMPRTSLNQENTRLLHGHGSSGGYNSSSMMIKCLCSFRGRILPRPSDGKLRYVGGQTRILRIRKDISWQELIQKALLIYNQVHVLKYQLPGEDLDALISVSSDEDLQNMMEECNHLEGREYQQKLRMFLFSMSDLDDAQFALSSSSTGDDSEVQYVVAVNGMDLGSGNHSTALGVSFSANDIRELDRQNMERETSRVAVESVGVSSALLINTFDYSLATQFSQSEQLTFSNSYETNQLSYGDQIVQAGDTNHQYHVLHGLNPSHNPLILETPISIVPRVLNNLQGVLNENPPPRGFQIQNSEIPMMQEKKIGDSSVQQGSDTGEVLSSETPAPSQPFDGYLENISHEASSVVTMPEEHLPSTKKVEHQDHDETSTSSSVFVPANVDSHSNGIDLTCLHPPPLPERVYCSERSPKEQVELLNRSSKSDDNLNSQFHVSDLLSDVNPEDSITESGDNLHDGNLPNPTEELSTAAKCLPADGHTIDNGFAKPEMNKPFPDTNSQTKSNPSERMDPELNQVSQNNDGSKDVVKDDCFSPLLDKTKTKDDQSNLPALDHVSSVKHHDDPASSLPEIDWGDAYGKESNDNYIVQPLPVSLIGNITKDVSQDSPANVVSGQAQSDILIDIDDRFPRDLLSDIFSKAILGEDPSTLHPLATDGVGLSINMENHEPKSWSYFQILAQEGLENVSLIDQDHLGFSPVIGKSGDNIAHHFMPLTTDGFPLDHADSHLSYGEENQDLHPRIGTETNVLSSNYDESRSLVKDTESMQFDAIMESLRAPESEYEDGKFETRNSNLPPLDPSLGDFDIDAVQVIKNEDLEELWELGSGTFGTVYHGKWRGTDVAIKRIKKSCFTGRSSEQERLTIEFWREAAILSKLHHPNVVAFYGVVQDGPGGTMATVTEYMVDGALRHILLRKDRVLDRRKRLIIAMDAAFGMEYLHSKNIVHFDLKCDNLLVNLKDPLRPICKVGDFGLSKIKRNTLVTGGVRGTLPWMAPELLNGSSNKVSEKVDVFSFGIVLWEILTGEEPYANMHYGAIIGGIANNTLRPTIPSHCDLEWRTLMEQCWEANPATRPSFTEIASRLRVMSAAASQTKTQNQKASK
ncbi:PREDICTED: uncharacterized protein LOC109339365 [Lupinus angustifolius]|nr:PREDICTED: uncharacterized protein LOC109339365 [Lupinus angustifolius]